LFGRQSIEGCGKMSQTLLLSIRKCDGGSLSFILSSFTQLQHPHGSREGKHIAQISSACCVTLGTVKNHVRNILNKLCVSDYLRKEGASTA